MGVWLFGTSRWGGFSHYCSCSQLLWKCGSLPWLGAKDKWVQLLSVQMIYKIINLASYGALGALVQSMWARMFRQRGRLARLNMVLIFFRQFSEWTSTRSWTLVVIPKLLDDVRIRIEIFTSKIIFNRHPFIWSFLQAHTQPKLMRGQPKFSEHICVLFLL